MLLWMISTALAVDSWKATCPTKDDPSVWFVFAQAADAKPDPDYDCEGTFFDGVACTQTIGLGKIRATGASPGGYPTFELRYLPYGDAFAILNFLNKPDGGVLFKMPALPVTTPAATPPPPNPTDLLELYLNQRNRSSAATKNIQIHVWSCPDAHFLAPDGAITPFGMTLVSHQGKTPTE
jgi:hypothetical protein